MKKILIVLLALAILGAAAIALAGVSGTAHDVRELRGNTSLEPCAFCHTPHQGAIASYPLWNRSGGPSSFTVYTSSTFNMGPASGTLDRGSAPCMVCHSGVVSELVNYPGRGSVANSNYNLSSADLDTWTNIGTDLLNEHPVSFSYASSADQQNNGFPSSGGGTIAGGAVNFPLYAASGSTAPNQFSCATCHTVHHTPVATYDTVNQVYFLRTSNAGSAMCDQCHTNRL